MNRAFYTKMKSPFLLFVIVLLLGSANSCKKVCYTCNQYCAYCALKRDSSIVYKVCTDRFSDHLRIDSIENSFPDSLYICNILNNSTDVCDGQNSIAQAVVYYEKEDYFCVPK